MNKIKITAYMFIVWAAFCTSFIGCSSEPRMYLEAKQQEGQTQPDRSREAAESAEQNDADAADAASDPDSNPSSGSKAGTCFVYVCGAVKKPGVFEVPVGSRIYELITLAGGLKKNASVKGLNQAQPVADGDMIEILTRAQQRKTDQAGKGSADTGISTGTAQDGRINLNTASAAELMTLNGIGEVKAANIIAYRQENGPFSAIEEIKNVSGIGDGVYTQIQDKITV